MTCISIPPPRSQCSSARAGELCVTAVMTRENIFRWPKGLCCHWSNLQSSFANLLREALFLNKVQTFSIFSLLSRPLPPPPPSRILIHIEFVLWFVSLINYAKLWHGAGDWCGRSQSRSHAFYTNYSTVHVTSQKYSFHLQNPNRHLFCIHIIFVELLLGCHTFSVTDIKQT